MCVCVCVFVCVTLNKKSTLTPLCIPITVHDRFIHSLPDA